MPLTGGYRKTPVMQIGADIYCDTQLIMLELDKRLPAPALAAQGPRGRGAGARHVDRPQHLLAGRRRGHEPDPDRGQVRRDLQEGPQRILRPVVRSRAAARGAAGGARPDLCPAVAGQDDARRRAAIPAGGRAEPGRLRALQSGVVHPEPAGRRHGRAARPAARHRRLVGAHEGAGRRQAHRHHGRPRRSTSPRRPNPADHGRRCQRSQRAQGRPEDQRHAGRHRQGPG